MATPYARRFGSTRAARRGAAQARPAKDSTRESLMLSERRRGSLDRSDADAKAGRQGDSRGRTSEVNSLSGMTEGDGSLEIPSHARAPRIIYFGVTTFITLLTGAATSAWPLA